MNTLPSNIGLFISLLPAIRRDFMVYSVGLCAAEMATVDGWEEGGVSPGYQILWGRDGDLQRSHLASANRHWFYSDALFRVRGTLHILKWPALNEDPITKTIAALSFFGRWH